MNAERIAQLLYALQVLQDVCEETPAYSCDMCPLNKRGAGRAVCAVGGWKTPDEWTIRGSVADATRIEVLE